MEYCTTESGGPYLWWESIARFIRLEMFVDGTGTKIKTVDLRPNVQSTLAVIVASVEECSQQFVLPE